MLALPDVRPGAHKTAMVDSEGWMAVGGKGVRVRQAADAAVADGVGDGTSAGTGGATVPAPLGLGAGGFALLAGLEEGEVGEEVDEEEGEARDEGKAAPVEGAEGGEAAAAAVASGGGAGAPASVAERGSRRKRLLDDSILRCPQRSLVADVMALYRRRMGGVLGARAAQLAVHADAIVVSVGRLRWGICGHESSHRQVLLTDSNNWRPALPACPVGQLPGLALCAHCCSAPLPDPFVSLSASPPCPLLSLQGAADHREAAEEGASAGPTFDVLTPDALAHVLVRMDAR